jgi:L-glyceraldehyde 3-phosphate reductase
VKILKEMGVNCLIYQPPYSILNRWPEAEGIHEWLDDKGIGSIVFSPLAQGMLTGKYVNGIPDGSRAARAEGFLQTAQVESQIEKIRALHQIAGEHGMSLQHLALRWVLSQQGVTSALIGARTVAQLDDSLAALDAPTLDQETLELIDSIAPAVRKDDAEG